MSARVTKRELAKAIGVSIVTLDRWLDRFGEAVPCVERGSNGRPYQYDLEATVAFFRERREDEKARQAERDEQLAQLALPIELPAAADPGAISLKDQVLGLQLRKAQREEAERLKLLVPAAAMRDAMSEAFATLSRRLHQRLRSAAQECGLPDEVMRKLDLALTEAQREFVDEVQRRAA